MSEGQNVAFNLVGPVHLLFLCVLDVRYCTYCAMLVEDCKLFRNSFPILTLRIATYAYMLSNIVSIAKKRHVHDVQADVPSPSKPDIDIK